MYDLLYYRNNSRRKHTLQWQFGQGRLIRSELRLLRVTLEASGAARSGKFRSKQAYVHVYQT